MKTKVIDTTTKAGFRRLNMLVCMGRWKAVKVEKHRVTIARAKGQA